MAAEARRRRGSRQAELFARSKCPVIPIDPVHRLVLLTEEIDWTELQELVQAIRESKLKSAAGRPPRLRALVGALVLRATRHMTYRETEDQIRHYAPARYLCGLTETDWWPDANTIQDFEQLLGEDGVKRINEFVVKWAVKEKLADPTVVAADTTAQEAPIPYPNEMRLMATFVSAVAAASKNVGSALKGFVARAGQLFETAKRKLREFRLFAKNKTKAARMRLISGMASVVDGVQKHVAHGIAVAAQQKAKLTRYRKVAWHRLQKLHRTMQRLLPQIRYWIRTGFVAANKIVSLQIPEAYAIVRGKVGKPVEFGLNWGIARLRGGFLLATMAKDKRELVDARFAVRAVEDHVALFGKAPRGYAYDRAGSSQDNVAAIKKLGVTHVGLAPRGQAKWHVSGKTKDTLVSERAQVEAGIGAIKMRKYGFTRPAAKSAATMGMCGQRAVLGFNLNKLARGLAERKGLAFVG
jgi:IS5 family transposase